MKFSIHTKGYRKLLEVFDNTFLIFLIICFGISQFSFSQILKDVDAIFPFEEESAAVKKGQQWAFINKEGVKIIDFRDDLVITQTETTSKGHPMFVEGKCLIKKMKDGIYYYGYIDKNGKTVITPKFLNATNFKDGYAIVIELEKSKMGSNSILGKSVTNLKLEEYVIDATGKVVKYLENSRGYVPSDAKVAPKFSSKFISSSLVAVKELNGKWTIHKFK